MDNQVMKYEWNPSGRISEEELAPAKLGFIKNEKQKRMILNVLEESIKKLQDEQNELNEIRKKLLNNDKR